ncbi:hypothetical protein GCM10020367_69170 [Streptomyces sannanensis]|uniref:Uncharacterized protein n=1 Tax=Streptomyces sannanensis TaxID=285536 RepID=A0ABP6SP64_9ACTN
MWPDLPDRFTSAPRPRGWSPSGVGPVLLITDLRALRLNVYDIADRLRSMRPRS